jgi:hypothetical protein
MIDFNNASFVKLRPVNDNAFEKMVAPILVNGEEIVRCFQSIRDGVVFTSKRIITINIQGITGKKKDFTSLPYNKIQSFSVETAGAFDLDSELELWFSGMGRVKLEFIGATDIAHLCKLISEKVL